MKARAEAAEQRLAHVTERQIDDMIARIPRTGPVRGECWFAGKDVRHALRILLESGAELATEYDEIRSHVWRFAFFIVAFIAAAETGWILGR